MGQIIKTCHLDCWDSDEKDKRFISKTNIIDANSVWEGVDGEYTLRKFSLFPGGIKYSRKPKIPIEFPLKLKNLFFEHYSNPWSIYT